MVYTNKADGKKTVYKVADFEGKGGCALGMYNTHFSIENFAHNCF